MSHTKEEFIKDFAPIQVFLEEYERANKALSMLCDGHSVFDIGCKLLDSYVDILAEKYEDTSEWIAYFIWECDSGTRPMHVFIDKEKVLMDSLDSLYYIITH